MAAWESVLHCDPTVSPHAAGVPSKAWLCRADYHKLLEIWCAGEEVLRWLSLVMTPIQLGLSKAGSPGFLDRLGWHLMAGLGVSFALCSHSSCCCRRAVTAWTVVWKNFLAPNVDVYFCVLCVCYP